MRVLAKVFKGDKQARDLQSDAIIAAPNSERAEIPLIWRTDEPGSAAGLQKRKKPKR